MRNRFSESEIINLLGAIEVKISGGMVLEEACRSLGVSDKSYYRWRKLYGSMGRTEVKHCQDLEKEEVLNPEAFYSWAEAQAVIAQWVHQCNHTRPHQSLNNRPSVPETIAPTLSKDLVHTQGA